MNSEFASKVLRQYEDPTKAVNVRKFFKNSKDDVFLGVPAHLIRKVAKEFVTLSLEEILTLMKSDVHDERSLAHAILCLRFRKGDQQQKAEIFKFYVTNRGCIRDWDGVDDTAPYIVGAYLLNQNKSLLYELAQSEHIWDRRMAIVSTWWFVRHQHINDTLNIAKLLLNDKEDLIHKATGWMLREVGKRDLAALMLFLELYAKPCQEQC